MAVVPYTSLLLVALLASNLVVEAHLSDGQRRTGELRQLNSQGIELSVDGEVFHVPRQEIKLLDFGNSPNVTSTVARGFMLLVDGSQIMFQSIELSAETIRVNSDADSPTWESPVHAAQAIRWVLSGEKTDQQWNEIMAKGETSDLLVIRRAQGTFDYLKGVVLGITDEAVHFEFSGNTVPVPLAKIAGVILFRKRAEFPYPRLRLVTRDGSRWLLDSAELARDELSITSVSRVSRRLHVNEVNRIEFPQLNAVYVTDLEPLSISFTPYFGSQQLDASIEQLRAPQVDRSFDGLPLRVGDPTRPSGWQQHRRGLAIHSRTAIVYRLAGHYRRFRATAGIDPLASSGAHVELIITADDEPRLMCEITKEDNPIPIDVDVAEVR